MTTTEVLDAPEWITNDVLPNMEGHVRSVQMLHEKAAIVLGDDHALVAEKGTFSGVKLFRVDYPPGFLLNGSHCPHCDQAIKEPVGKVARLASEVKGLLKKAAEASQTRQASGGSKKPTSGSSKKESAPKKPAAKKKSSSKKTKR